MRTRYHLLCASLAFAGLLRAQSPDLFNYQAAVREGGVPATGPIDVRFAVVNAADDSLYIEVHDDVPLNPQGIFNVRIGGGAPDIGYVTDDFADIPWDAGTYRLVVQVDPDDDGNFAVLSQSQLVSVPYALHARTADVPGVQGPAGTDGHSILNGTEDPSSGLGNDGDFYLNTTTNVLFGPKVGPSWGTGVLLVGPPGEDGEPGEDGTGVTILGTVDVPGDLPSSGSPGDGWLIDGDLYVWSDNTNSWNNVGNIQGPQGEQGIQGIQGIQGLPGTNGTNGIDGMDGADGTPGEDGRTVLNGTGNPTVGTGNDGDFYINISNSTLFGPKTGGAWGTGVTLVGPPGANGTNGSNGTNGIDGTDGADGASGEDGRTVLNGSGNPNAGTGNDGDFYININNSTLFGPKTGGAWGTGVSLVGPPGANGTNGSNGMNGVNGTNGVDGRTILNGTTNPLAGTGANGDFYINTVTSTLFGPKAGGSWPTGVSLIGPQGPPGGGNGWSLTGNAGTDPAINFLGTTDDQPLRIRLNNLWTGEVNNVTDNVWLGEESGIARTTGTNNTGLGSFALAETTTGKDNVAIGQRALRANAIGEFNTAVGSDALYTGTSGSRNTALGYQSLFSNNASENTAVGYQAMYTNSSGIQNTATGHAALHLNTTGSYNSAVGLYASFSNTTGSQNTAVGRYALKQNTIGILNTAVGDRAGENATGNYNCFFGYNAGEQAVSLIGDYTTLLGGNTGASDNNDGLVPSFNETAIGHGAFASSQGQVRLGDVMVQSIMGQVDFAASSDKRFKRNIREDVPGLEFVLKLRPVTYDLDIHALIHYGDERDPAGAEARQRKLEAYRATHTGSDETIHPRQTGFLAQDVEATAKDMGYDFSGVDAPSGSEGLYGLRYGTFVVPLVKAVQELNAQKESLSERLAEQERELAELRSMVERITSQTQAHENR